jgi:hypothetical protein
VLKDTFRLTHELAGVGRGTPPPPRSRSSCKLDGVLARIIHERSVNNPGLHASGHSRSGMTHGGGRSGYQFRIPLGEHSVEMPQPALFASRVRE